VIVEFVELAEIELDEAIYHYESELPGLGAQFWSEGASAIDRIVGFPEAWQELESGVRRCLLQRFPYGVSYMLRDHDTVVVVAVTHLHRKPRSWRSRLES
jgi:plasmid stabilization system protein ParE